MVVFYFEKAGGKNVFEISSNAFSASKSSLLILDDNFPDAFFVFFIVSWNHIPSVCDRIQGLPL